MTTTDAKRIVDFVVGQSPEKPLIIHCTAGISRSGAVGMVLNDWLNRRLSSNEEDYNHFYRENPDLYPNEHVQRLLWAEIESRYGGHVQGANRGYAKPDRVCGESRGEGKNEDGEEKY